MLNDIHASCSSLWSKQNCRNFGGKLKYKSDYKKQGDSQREQTMSTMSTQHASAVGMIWVMDSIPWFRCASGNVYRNSRTIVLETFGGEAFSVADILVLVRIQQSFLWVLGIQFVMCLENLKFEPEWRENVRSSPSYHNPATELSGLGENRPLQHLTRFTDFHRINFSKCENCLI